MNHHIMDMEEMTNRMNSLTFSYNLKILLLNNPDIKLLCHLLFSLKSNQSDTPAIVYGSGIIRVLIHIIILVRKVDNFSSLVRNLH